MAPTSECSENPYSRIPASGVAPADADSSAEKCALTRDDTNRARGGDPLGHCLLRVHCARWEDACEHGLNRRTPEAVAPLLGGVSTFSSIWV